MKASHRIPEVVVKEGVVLDHLPHPGQAHNGQGKGRGAVAAGPATAQQTQGRGGVQQQLAALFREPQPRRQGPGRLRLGEETFEDPEAHARQHRLGGREAGNKIKEGPGLAPGEEPSER